MSQDILINKLFYSKDPFEDLNTVRPYYDGWYDNAIVIDTKAAKKYQERIPYHLKDLVVGYVRVKFDTYMDGVLNYTMRLGTNVFRGTYLHQLMEILNLYFRL